MHSWGDTNVDWEAINNAAEYIGLGLRKWGRMQVSDFKEKYGTVRVYCMFGWYGLHSLTHPGYAFCQYPKWLWYLDCCVLSKIIVKANCLVIPFHKWLYRRFYKNAIKRWPHIKEEILCCSDWPEYLEGL